MDHNKLTKISCIVPNAHKYELEPILLEILPDGIAYDDEPHIGEEFGCLLQGEILLKVGKKKVKIEKGQSFYYIANKAHALENHSKRKAVVLWVSTPPMF